VWRRNDGNDVGHERMEDDVDESEVNVGVIHGC